MPSLPKWSNQATGERGSSSYYPLYKDEELSTTGNASSSNFLILLVHLSYKKDLHFFAFAKRAEANKSMGMLLCQSHELRNECVEELNC